MFATFFRVVFMAIATVAQASGTPHAMQFDESGTLGGIRPPQGWVEQPVPDFPHVRVTNSFYDANAFSQRVLLGNIDETDGGSLASVVDAITTSLSNEFKIMIVSSRPHRLCDGAAADWMIRYTDPWRYFVETILVGRVRGTAAIYLRKRSDSEDPKALSALDSLCLTAFPK
jgi:hypothetical protein